MANKAVKEYDDFTGTNGYLIVDGLTDNESGGKMKVPNYSGVTDGYVLTKTTTDGADDVVWSAPAGGGSDPFSDIAEWDDEKNPAKKVKDHDTFPLEKQLYIHLKKDNDIIKHRMFFQYGGSGDNFYGPWGS